MLSLILYNIRSAHNVGSIFRTADAVGAKEIYLVGYTPDPVDKFKRARPDIAKVALGAEKTIPWSHWDDVSKLLMTLKTEGHIIYALEQATNALDYRSPSVKITSEQKVAVMLGEEVNGIPAEVLQLCDAVCEIPMRGAKESLNVSVAAGVLLYELTRNN